MGAVGTTVSGIESWAAKAARGDVFSYFIGNLANERHTAEHFPNYMPHELNSAAIAWSLYETGHVLLVQERAGEPGDAEFRYDAVRTNKEWNK